MKKDKKISFNDLKPIAKKYLKEQKKAVLFLGIIIFTAIGLQLINPQIIRAFIDQILGESEKNNLYKLAFLLLECPFYNNF